MRGWRESVLAVLITMAIFGVLMGMVEAGNAIRCAASWSIEHRYRVIGGCQVRGRQGWIPASAYRDVSP